MFSILNSYRMSKSSKTRGNPYVMERVLEVILRRLENPAENPPLRIAVFGGSVTEGCWSGRNSFGIHQLDYHCDVPCTWTTKLENLLNHILGNGTVTVRNYATSGSDSSIGRLLLEYNLIKDKNYKLSDFDIFVSAYAANDGQTPEAAQDFVFQDMQHFTRLCMDQRPCSDLPLVIKLEDVLIDAFKPNVRSGLSLMRDIAETTTWADQIMTVSYADAVREYVYRNPTETTLIEFRELHPGVTFHTGVAWVMAYNLLSSLLDACHAPTMPEYDSPEPRAGYLLPTLTDTLETEQVHEQWNMETQRKEKMCAEGLNETTCVYKWVAMIQDAKTAQDIESAISKHATYVDGWKATGFPVRKPRRTWLADKQNATFTLQFTSLNTPVNQLMILYLRSYGAKWTSTQLLVVVEGKNPENQDEWVELYRVHLEGEHDSTTSINYSHIVHIGDKLQKGDPTRITFTLVGGTTFQINGLALCYNPQATSKEGA